MGARTQFTNGVGNGIEQGVNLITEWGDSVSEMP